MEKKLIKNNLVRYHKPGNDITQDGDNLTSVFSKTFMHQFAKKFWQCVIVKTCLLFSSSSIVSKSLNNSIISPSYLRPVLTKWETSRKNSFPSYYHTCCSDSKFIHVTCQGCCLIFWGPKPIFPWEIPLFYWFDLFSEPYTSVPWRLVAHFVRTGLIWWHHYTGWYTRSVISGICDQVFCK